MEGGQRNQRNSDVPGWTNRPNSEAGGGGGLGPAGVQVGRQDRDLTAAVQWIGRRDSWVGGGFLAGPRRAAEREFHEILLPPLPLSLSSSFPFLLGRTVFAAARTCPRQNRMSYFQFGPCLIEVLGNAPCNFVLSEFHLSSTMQGKVLIWVQLI
jgi:hypothetical protein